MTGATAPQEVGTDAKGSPVEGDGPDNGQNESDPPPPPPPPHELDADDVEKLTKKQRKAAREKLEREEAEQEKGK